jgi:hypothetical protein
MASGVVAARQRVAHVRRGVIVEREIEQSAGEFRDRSELLGARLAQSRPGAVREAETVAVGSDPCLQVGEKQPIELVDLS